MDTLRRRNPFKSTDNEEKDSEHEILDEQQQEELIDKFRRENEAVNATYVFALKALIGLSFLLQIGTFNRNPLLSIYPIQGAESSMPLPVVFTVLAVYIYFNLMLLFFPSETLVRFNLLSAAINPLSFQLLYSLSAVAPTLCLFHQKPWQITMWWCLPGTIVFVVQTVVNTIQQSEQRIADLETMKYRAPGA